MRHEVRGVFRAKLERVSARPIKRHQEVAEERSRGAESLERLLPSRCRSKTARLEQRPQHGSATESLLWRSARAVCGKRMPVRYRFICDAQSIFDLKMLPESSGARLKPRRSPFSGVAAIHLRRTAPMEAETCGPEHRVLADRYFQMLYAL